MLFLVFAYTIDDIAVGIWAGKETIENRVLEQASTWMTFFKDVYVFSDEFPPGTCQKVNDRSKPCKIHCIEIGNMAEHLEGTEWTHRWYFAQPRFLPSMYKLYELNPGAKWYLYGDDDTYFFREPLLEHANTFNSSKKVTSGKFWCSWDRVSADIPPFRSCRPFGQGGAGVLISKGLMNIVGPTLMNCSQSFNDPDFAGSMRFAVCAERAVGPDQWNDGKVIYPSKRFHSSPPDIEISQNEVTEPPITFHRIFPGKFRQIFNYHTGILGVDQYMDFSSVSLAEITFPVANGRKISKWRLGYGFVDVDGTQVNSTGPFTAFFDKNRNLKGFKQQYTRRSMTLHCCDCSDSSDRVFFSHEEKDGYHFIFNCNRTIVNKNV